MQKHVCVCVCMLRVSSVGSNSLWTYGLKPTRLLCPWDFPGKNTGVGYYFPPGNLSDPGIKCISLASPALKADSLLMSHWEGPYKTYAYVHHTALCIIYLIHSLWTYTSQIFCEGHKLYISYSRRIPCSLPKSASVFDNYMHFYIINAKVDA